MKWNEILEDAIIGKLLRTLIDEGFRVEACNQDGGGLYIYAAPNAGKIPPKNCAHWVWLVCGNGCDIIGDYSTNLEAIMGPMQDWIATFEG